MPAQHLFNIFQTTLLYGLVAFGFHLASKCCRHYAFVAAASFIIGPYVAFAIHEKVPLLPRILIALLVCAVLGVSYQVLTRTLHRRGAREGQLLIVSLATMAIAENLVTLLCGAASVSLWPYQPEDSVSVFGVSLTVQELTYVSSGSAALAITTWVWCNSLSGKIFRALEDSPLSLELRGYNVAKWERIGAAVGFALMGLAGNLWAVSVRVKPAMCTEVSIAGALLVLAGATLVEGPIGLLISALLVAGMRLTLSLTLAGDWNLSAMLILLFVVVIFRRDPRRLGSTRGA